MKKNWGFCLVVLCLACLMMNLIAAFVPADNPVFSNVVYDSTNKLTHLEALYKKNATNVPLMKNALIASSASAQITIIWPEPGYYYITDFLLLEINSSNNANCSYSIDSSKFQEMNSSDSVSHYYVITNLKDNMGGDPYVVEFNCVDEQGAGYSASTYFWINTTELDKYILRNNFSQWIYQFSENRCSCNNNSMLEIYEGAYFYTNQSQEYTLIDIISIYVFDNENSAKNFIKENLLDANQTDFSVELIGDKRVYVFEDSTIKFMVWNSRENIIANMIFASDNSTISSVEHPMEIINPYMQKYLSDVHVVCLSNLDCGIDRQSGPVCSDSNVTEIYTNFTCHNPGQENSYCTNYTYTPAVIGCGSGVCMAYAYGDEYKYCKGKDIYAKQNCTDVGCSLGACYNNGWYIKEKLVETCQFNCNNGKCLEPFNLTIQSPTEKIYDTSMINFNVSSSVKLSRLDYIDYSQKSPKWLTLCTKCSTFSRKLSFNDGTHDLEIKATDSYGNSESKNISFSIDSKEPKTITTKPRKNDESNGSLFYIKYSEDNLKNITLYYGEQNITLSCSPGNNKNCTTSLDLSSYDGQYLDYWFVVSDYARDVSSKSTRIKVDTSIPILNVNSPSNVNYARRVPFNISISEKAKLEYYDNSALRPRWKSLCSNCDKYTSKKSFSIGAHDIIIRATDKAGNSAEVSRNFLVA